MSFPAIRSSWAPSPVEDFLGLFTPSPGPWKKLFKTLLILVSCPFDLSISFKTTSGTNSLPNCLLQQISNCLSRSHKDSSDFSWVPLPGSPPSFVLHQFHIFCFKLLFFFWTFFSPISKFFFNLKVWNTICVTLVNLLTSKDFIFPSVKQESYSLTELL